MHGLESGKADAVLDKLDYLNQHYDKTVVSEFVEQPFLRYKFKVDYSYADVNLWRTNNDSIDVEIPDGFTRCGYFNDHPVEVISVSERTFRMSLKQGDGVYEFDFPILGVNHPVTLTALEGRAITSTWTEKSWMTWPTTVRRLGSKVGLSAACYSIDFTISY